MHVLTGLSLNGIMVSSPLWDVKKEQFNGDFDEHVISEPNRSSLTEELPSGFVKSSVFQL